MPRIVKPKPPTVPITAYFHLKPHVWDAIANYAYKHNRGNCSVMQDFLEVGLLEYLRYETELLQEFKRRDARPPTPPPAPVHDPDTAYSLEEGANVVS